MPIMPLKTLRPKHMIDRFPVHAGNTWVMITVVCENTGGSSHPLCNSGKNWHGSGSPRVNYYPRTADADSGFKSDLMNYRHRPQRLLEQSRISDVASVHLHPGQLSCPYHRTGLRFARKPSEVSVHLSAPNVYTLLSVSWGSSPN